MGKRGVSGVLQQEGADLGKARVRHGEGDAEIGSRRGADDVQVAKARRMVVRKKE